MWMHVYGATTCSIVCPLRHTYCSGESIWWPHACSHAATSGNHGLGPWAATAHANLALYESGHNPACVKSGGSCMVSPVACRHWSAAFLTCPVASGFVRPKVGTVLPCVLGLTAFFYPSCKSPACSRFSLSRFPLSSRHHSFLFYALVIYSFLSLPYLLCVSYLFLSVTALPSMR